MGDIRINTDNAKKEFKRHLEIEDNERIIFSGQFGIGKTTFLKEFKEAYSDKYRVFHLFPVNYSVASNEDIFELVKYDLFYEVLGHKPDLGGVDLNKIEFLPFFLAGNWDTIAKSFLKFIPKVGKTLSEMVEEYEKLKRLFDSSHMEFVQSHGEVIELFSKDIQDKTGQIYEFDQFSQLLKELIENLNSNDSKENVLIIDDLDRVDPDHLFRLLNVFAAHVDFDKEEKNKFGFHKVVFVMDINNVHKIFENRYGQDVDFTGYLDKFYSKEVFEFKVSPFIREIVRDVLGSILVGDDKVGVFDNDVNAINVTSSYLINAFIKVGSLNLRALMKLKELKYHEKSDKYFFATVRRNLFTDQLNVYIVLDFMTFVMGSTPELILALKRCLFVQESKDFEIHVDEAVRHMFSDLLPVLDISYFPLQGKNTVKKYLLHSKTGTKAIEYTGIGDDQRYGARIKSVYRETTTVMGVESERASEELLVSEYLRSLISVIEIVEESRST